MDGSAEGDARGQQLYEELEAAAGACSAQPSAETAAAVSQRLSGLLAAGLEGNRLVEPTPWGVVKAMARAFPLLLDKSIQHAERIAQQQQQQQAEGQGGAAPALGTEGVMPTTSLKGLSAGREASTGSLQDVHSCMQAWVQQAIAKGLVGPLLHKLASQPQVASAYASDAPIRDAALARRVAELLRPLQDPLSKLHRQSQSQGSRDRAAAEQQGNTTEAQHSSPAACQGEDSTPALVPGQHCGTAVKADIVAGTGAGTGAGAGSSNRSSTPAPTASVAAPGTAPVPLPEPPSVAFRLSSCHIETDEDVLAARAQKAAEAARQRTRLAWWLTRPPPAGDTAGPSGAETPQAAGTGAAGPGAAGPGGSGAAPSSAAQGTGTAAARGHPSGLAGADADTATGPAAARSGLEGSGVGVQGLGAGLSGSTTSSDAAVAASGASSSVSVAASVLGALPTRLAFSSLWGATQTSNNAGAGAGVAAGAASKSASGAAVAAAFGSGTGSGAGSGPPAATTAGTQPQVQSSEQQQGIGEDSACLALTIELVVSADEERPLVLQLCINQQQQQQQQQEAHLQPQQPPALGTSGYNTWASSVGSRLLPFKLWAPAGASAASAANAAGVSASSASASGIPAGGDGTGAAAPSTAAAGSCSASVQAAAAASALAAGSDVGVALGASEAEVGTSSATNQAAAVTNATATVTMDDATVGPLSVEIKLRSGATPGNDQQVILVLSHRPPPVSASTSSLGSWMYGAAAKWVDPGAWSRGYAPATTPVTMAPAGGGAAGAGLGVAALAGTWVRRSNSRGGSGGGSAVGAGESASVPAAPGPAAASADSAACVTGDSDDEFDLGVLEDMRQVLAGAYDQHHDGSFSGRALGPPSGLSAAGGADAPGARRSSSSSGSAGAAAGAGVGAQPPAETEGSASAPTAGSSVSSQLLHPQQPALLSGGGSTTGPCPKVRPTSVSNPVPAPGTAAPSAASAAAGAPAEPAARMATARVRLQFDLVPLGCEPVQWHNQGGLCAGCRAPIPQPQPLGVAPSLARSNATATAAAATGSSVATVTSGSSVGGGGATGARSYFWSSSSAGVAAASSPVPQARLCNYTGKLYCTSCHQQGHAIVPARVLHKWDFTPQPVCCAAADYLASIYEQPVLCVAAINPGLYTRVAQLSEAHTLRQRIRSKLSTVRQAGHVKQVMALKHAAGARAYLLGEMEDFWALADLTDLSKGALATLPQWLSKVEADLTALSAL